MNIFDIGSKASFLFEVQGTSLSMSVLSFKSQERISSPYLVEVSLASSSEITFDNIMQKEALLTLIGLESDRYIHGIVRKFEHIGISGVGADKGKYLYRAEIVPFTQLLSLEQDCRIFQNKNGQDIVADIFKDSGVPSDRYEFRLKNKEHKRRFCVQYRETDLDFINRILQEEGIYYFYEHSKDKHLMVFTDDTTRHKSIAGNSKITFKPPSGRVPETEVINNIEFSQRLRPGTYSQTNYNFKHVSTPLDMKDKSKEENIQKYEIYDYPGQYGDQDKGKILTRINREAYNALQEQAIGESNCPRLLPGHTFSLDGYDLESFDKEYFLIEVTAAGGQAQALEEVSGSGETSYCNNFVAVPSSISYRPKKSIEKPYVKGIQTATVVGPENEEIYVDEYGRVKVQFHWDRKGKKDEQSSCWLRCGQTWGGAGWGAMFIPRIGDEVIVSFLEGDPDWPMITGSLYNGANPPLYDLPNNKTRSTIKTKSYPKSNGYNELRFEDKAGSEEVYLQGEKDWNILIKNDKGQTVGHDETLTVANNRVKTVGVNQTVSIGANHTETIGANKTETVSINKAETIGIAKELTVGGLYQVSVGAAMNETVIAAKTEEVGLTKAVFVGVHMTEKILGNRSISVDKDMSTSVKQNSTLKAKTITLEADDEIIFKTGDSIISMKSSGEIVINGATITENASGEIVIKGSKTAIN
ncbi:MAG: type VI secretion system tip protein VgrG [Deltaproteobacteria bacterium HGW-Deltaproteobacteria-1]|jgi:type VI secretion system secreted protein VgrG|nr:MAG: type VI secretion system tip protein VgrG [Deltaproteobacteria bacterium HGW-Deltaproteobacteria-1]